MRVAYYVHIFNGRGKNLQNRFRSKLPIHVKSKFEYTLGSIFNLIRLIMDHYVIFEYNLFHLSFTYSSFALFLLKKEVI